MLRAQLQDQSGDATELSVIDICAGGAALCGTESTWNMPRGSISGFSRGTIQIRTPTAPDGHKTVPVGSYEVVRQWSPGPGPDAGIALKFNYITKEWLELATTGLFELLRAKAQSALPV